MNQILFLQDDEMEQPNKENTVHTYKVKFLKTISIFSIGLIVITISSLGIFALATNTKESNPKISDSVILEDRDSEKISNNIIDEYKDDENNTVTENIIIDNGTNISTSEKKNQVQQDKIKKDTAALAQINTKTRKTSSGTKYTSIGLIKIPSLDIKYQILSKTTDSLLKISVCKFWGPNPNEVGNLCILGHNYKTSKFFGKLPNIKKGAKIYITDTNGRTLTYKVYETDIIKETDLKCTSQITNGKTEVTLITCYYLKGYTHATRRFIAKARVE